MNLLLLVYPIHSCLLLGRNIALFLYKPKAQYQKKYAMELSGLLPSSSVTILMVVRQGSLS